MDAVAAVRAEEFEAELQPADMAADLVFAANWLAIRAWDESSRYARKTQVEAQTLYDAITDTTRGVLPWLKLRW